MSKFYNDIYKWSLYADFRSGKTITQLCDVSGITDKPLRSWFKQFDSELAQVNALTIEEFCRENRRNREALQREQLEASLLQSIVLDSIPEIFRISCARRLLEKYGPNQVCRSLEIRKSNLYYQAFRRPMITESEKHNQELRPAIRSICANRSKRIGSEKVRRQLMDQGFTVSKHKVLELMRELRLNRIPAVKPKKQATDWQIAHINLLARQFSPPGPNKVWLSDITDIKTDAGVYHLCVVMDLFARKIVGARLSPDKEFVLVYQTFLDAFYSRGSPKGLIFHSDQGGQYTASSFCSLLLRRGVTQSFSAPGVPYDNAPMESFFASLKTEEIYRYRYRNNSDLTASLRAYLQFYHQKRPHTSLANRTPDQVEQEYFENQSADCDSSSCVPFA